MTTRGRPVSRGLADGRALPPLLFVTNRDALRRRIGAEAATAALERIREATTDIAGASHVILDNVEGTVGNPTAALRAVHEALSTHLVHGVILLGGYDVVPPVRFDVLPPALRAWIDGQPYDGGDPDDFIVWCDDQYGDPEHTGIPEIPVSRIPDGRSAALLLAALRAPTPLHAGKRRGLRNLRRPYVDELFALIPGEGHVAQSAPLHATALSDDALHGDHVYLLLHGLPDRGGTLWGERAVSAEASAAVPNPGSSETPVTMPLDITTDMFEAKVEGEQDGVVPAVHSRHMPGSGAVILSGCCWSAQASTIPARRWHENRRVVRRTVRTSVALAALRKGARAYVGSTGLNYSPMNAPYMQFCGPLHRAFWQSIARGAAPAVALLEAKHRFALGMPHGCGPDLVAQAIEHKTLHQYTCLGLGW